MSSAVERVEAAYARIAEADRPEVWIHLRPREDALADAVAIDARVAGGARLPLAGTTLAVKDNVDVAGLPTTAACPAYAYTPQRTATAVARLIDAGTVVLGKTNLDQFATGLVGTRSPYGAVRDVRRPERVSGGSSSGSSVAVALGITDLGVGTDTAGSGRVPAAFQGIVGFKATRGIVPITGVVPACRTLDCVTILAPTLAGAEHAMSIMAGRDPADPLSRQWPDDAPLAAPPAPRVAVPDDAGLAPLGPAERAAFDAAVARLAAAGATLAPIDLAPFLEVARMLYASAFVAERYAAVGAFVSAHGDACDPTVRTIIESAADFRAHVLLDDRRRMEELGLEAAAALAGADALLLPTAPEQPTIAAVQADPIALNSRLGTYTNFANLLDMAAVAVPAGELPGGGQFGVTVIARAFADRVAADIARLFTGEERSPVLLGPAGAELVVVGAHRRGQPLNGQLTARGARLEGVVHTATNYRLFALDTTPPKPGLVRAERGASIEGELWRLPTAGLGSFLAELPAPMALGRVVLDDGHQTTGFLCEPAALAGARDITEHGSWPAYLAVAQRRA